MKKFLVFGAVMALAILAVLDFKDQKEEAARKVRPRGFEVRRHSGVGGWNVASHETQSPTVEVPPVAAIESPEEIARKYLEDHGEELGLRSYHEMRPSIFQTPLGARVTYQVFQDGVPVIGSEIRLQIGRNHNVMDLDNRYVPLERVDLSAHGGLDHGQVQELMRISNYLPDPSVGDEPARVLYPVPGTNRAELAYVVSAREPSGSRRPIQVLLRASDGQVLGKNVSRAEFK